MSPEDAFVEVESRYPFDLEKAETEYQGWRLATKRIDDAVAFLNFPPPFKLQGTPGGEQYPANDEEPPNLGKRVFAQFRDYCYSEERRYPLYSGNPGIAIGANTVRAVTSNATKGRIWQNFSSKTYKELPSVGKIAFYNPLNPDHPIEYEFPVGGRGYCCTPFLISILAAVSLLHSNMPEIYNPDPPIEGRAGAFIDAAEKLLWPEKRLGVDSIKRFRPVRFERLITVCRSFHFNMGNFSQSQ